jgi:hypothetical protein
MDETGARVGVLASEEVVVPWDITELYVGGSENRKSLTVIETINAAGNYLPAYVIAPGKKVMENWINAKLSGEDVITPTPTGYINNDIAMHWLDWFIKQIGAGPTEPWQILFCDGHSTHDDTAFKIKAADNHILVIIYPSHETHALQPLDVKVFREWKKQHKKAVNEASRSYNFEYSITNFFQDLPAIHKATFQPRIIRSGFKEAGMWPISLHMALKKRSEYNGKRVNAQERMSKQKQQAEEPQLPKPLPKSYFESTVVLEEMVDRGVIGLASSPYSQRYRDAIGSIKGMLHKVTLQEDSHANC